MTNIRSQTRFRFWQACVVVFYSVLACAQAHDQFTRFIQHRVQLWVTAEHMDVTVQLTFFEEWSMRERQCMDGDGDGRVLRAETEDYLKMLATNLTDQVGLSVDGVPVDLIPLYAPKIDLCDENRVAAPGHHRLTLHYFAATPAELRPGSEIVLADQLWSGADAIALWGARGRDGCLLEARPLSDSLLPALRSGLSRRFAAQCLQPPSDHTVPSIPDPTEP